MYDNNSWDLLVSMNEKYASMSSEKMCEIMDSWRFPTEYVRLPATEVDVFHEIDHEKKLFEEEVISKLPLSDKCNYYRKQTNYCLPPKSYGIIMVDGKNFSTRWKNILGLGV